MDKDELRELIATEVQKILKVACDAAVDVPNQPHEMQFATSPEGMKANEARKKEARRITASILSAVDDYVRNSNAEVVKKTDPRRAQRIKDFKPTF